MFYTLHDFLLSSKSVTYVVMGLVLIGLTLFWAFFLGKDEDRDLKVK
jgi:hypothetical protein